jgi:hypothetical protein
LGESGRWIIRTGGKGKRLVIALLTTDEEYAMKNYRYQIFVVTVQKLFWNDKMQMVYFLLAVIIASYIAGSVFMVFFPLPSGTPDSRFFAPLIFGDVILLCLTVIIAVPVFLEKQIRHAYKEAKSDVLWKNKGGNTR